MASSSGPERKKTKPWKQERHHPIVEPSLISSDMIEIDGSILEGGGQILRNTVTLSCLLGKPVHITRIRAKRSNPGLRPQHLHGIRLISEMCRGKLTGDGVGSSDIMFIPGSLQSGQYVADTKTAGSICLLVQAVLPCLIFNNNTQVILRGGTNADMAPPIDYLLKVFKPMIARSGVEFDCILNKRGFFPKGGGQVTLISKSINKSLSSFDIITKGDISIIDINVFTAGGAPRRVGHEMCSSARNILQKQFTGSINSNVEHIPEQQAFGTGSGILITTRTTSGCVFGGSGVGNRKQSPDNTGQLAAEEFIDGIEGNNCVDSHLQDQLIIFMALAEGKSRVRTGPLTLHTETAIHIVQIMTGVNFEVTEISKDENIIECIGIGYNNNNNN